MERFDIAIIGGGIIGLATALALVQASRRARSVVVLEAESEFARHQSGHNSGVIHAGLYYKPGSLKARLCAEGRAAMERFCDERGVPRERCGKVVVAVNESQLPALAELERRGHANGLEGLTRLNSPAEIRIHEPHAAGIAGLFVPQTGITDYRAVTRAMAGAVKESGGEVRMGCRVTACARSKRSATGRLARSLGGPGNSTAGDEHIVLETTRGEVACRLLVNCAGLHSDRIARMCGVEPELRIVPFRGEYHELTEAAAARGLVRNLLYPVPDARFPFLGVHFTRMIAAAANGVPRIEAGPNAVLATARHGYGWSKVNARDAFEVISYRGMWALARRHWRTGMGEVHRSLSRTAFVRALRELLPELTEADLIPGRPARAGVRAQAVRPDGSLVDDFWIRDDSRSIHVLNAPSPGATSSIAIGRHIAALASERLGSAARA